MGICKIITKGGGRLIVATTPTHTFNIPFDTSTITSVRVVYKQNDEIICKKNTEDCVLEDRKVIVNLTQEDTFKFDHESNVKIQIAIKTLDEKVLRSIPITRGVTECLDDEVM